MTLRTKTALTVALFTATLASAGCGTMAAGKPDTGHSSTSAKGSRSGDESRLPHHGAPKVPNPIDISTFKQDPCRALTTRQLKTLGVARSEREQPNTGTGAACDWGHTYDHGVAPSITYIPNPGGLSDLYAINQQQPDKYALFKPSSPINGFPSVLLHVDANEQKNGVCSYLVGLNDRTAVKVLIQEESGGTPCDDAKQVALSITKTMKRGGR